MTARGGTGSDDGRRVSAPRCGMFTDCSPPPLSQGLRSPATRPRPAWIRWR